MAKLSETKKRLLQLLSQESMSVPDAAYRLGLPVSSVSSLRNQLHSFGLVEQWALWEDPMRLSSVGLAFLKSHEGKQ